ncbi:MAG: DUF3486 family protein [Burkholderiaceae bacterium]|nr:MAG: DUF3486 family protein [Burkholderiaceae bacterium]
MPPTMLVLRLPSALRSKLDAKLRANAYGDIVSACGWLKEKGHSIGLSSIHRYALLLRRMDASNGVETAMMLEARKRK